MKCPSCGEFVDNTLWRAIQPYRSNKAVVLSNIDGILEVGDRIVAVFEEKHGRKRVRGYQAILLRKVARKLQVPLFYVFESENTVEVYEYPTDQIIRSSPFINLNPEFQVFSGSISEFGEYLYNRFLIHAPLSRVERRKRVCFR